MISGTRVGLLHKRLDLAPDERACWRCGITHRGRTDECWDCKIVERPIQVKTLRSLKRSESEDFAKIDAVLHAA